MSLGWKLYWLLVAATLAVYSALVLWVGPKIADLSSGGAAFDYFMLGYSHAEAKEFLAALTPEGAAFYLGPAMWLDTVFPAMLALVLGIGCWWLLRERPLILRLGAALIAAGYALFDYLENAAIARMLTYSADTLSAELVAGASRFTVLKFFFFDAAITVLIVLLIARAIWRLFGAAPAVQFTVAIDGPAAAGKGTISRVLAKEFRFAYLDTGLLYRAVGVKALAAGGTDAATAEAEARALEPGDLTRDDLRSPEASAAASEVAVHEGVRAALIEFQRKFARRDGGAVLDGRDIGTVICPDAEVKLFITATPEVRAARRHAELQASGVDISLDEVLADVGARDARDRNRAEAPLVAADDAVVIDTSSLSIKEAVATAAALVAEALARRG